MKQPRRTIIEVAPDVTSRKVGDVVASESHIVCGRCPRCIEGQGHICENTVILGVSVDSVWANKAFREQLGVEFPILSDTKRELSKKLGVYDETNDVARRTTFVIDMGGVVRHIDQQRDAAAHADSAIGVCRLMKK